MSSLLGKVLGKVCAQWVGLGFVLMVWLVRLLPSTLSCSSKQHQHSLNQQPAFSLLLADRLVAALLRLGCAPLSNPANCASQTLQGTHRVAVPGFYDQVQSMSASDKEDVAAFPFDERDEQEALGVMGFMGELLLFYFCYFVVIVAFRN